MSDISSSEYTGKEQADLGERSNPDLEGVGKGPGKRAALVESVFHWEGQGPAPGLNLAPSLGFLSPQTQAVWGCWPLLFPFSNGKMFGSEIFESESEK